MTGMRLIDLTRDLGVRLFLPNPAEAQVPSPGLPPTPPATGAASAGDGTTVAAIVIGLALLAILVGGIKLYDVKRKRDEAGMALGARLSDALLVEPALRGYPVVATARVPLMTRSETVVEVRGTVPTMAVREIARNVVARELRGEDPTARVEDHIAVDPKVVERVA